MQRPVVCSLLAICAVLGFACDSDEHATRTSPARSTAQSVIPSATAVRPQFLVSPVATSGDGWSIEERVSNVVELDLAVAVVDRSPYKVSIIDLPSGQTVAVGDFGSGLFVRLRRNPTQLIVSDYVEPTGWRLLVFEISNAGFALASQVAISDRYYYQGFSNQMHLSTDQRFVYFGTRALVDRPECRGSSYDGIACLRYSIQVVDLEEPHAARAVLMPERCSPYVTPIPDGFVSLCGYGVLIAGNDGAVQEIPGYYSISVRPVAGWPDSLAGEYATALRDGAPRVVYGDGSIRGQPNEILTQSILPAGHQLFGRHAIDDAHVLLEAGERRAGGGPTSEILIVDLTDGTVLHRIGALLDTFHASVLDADRGIILLRSDARCCAYQMIDFATGRLGDVIELQGLTDQPVEIVR